MQVVSLLLVDLLAPRLGGLLLLRSFNRALGSLHTKMPNDRIDQMLQRPCTAACKIGEEW